MFDVIFSIVLWSSCLKGLFRGPSQIAIRSRLRLIRRSPSLLATVIAQNGLMYEAQDCVPG